MSGKQNAKNRADERNYPRMLEPLFRKHRLCFTDLPLKSFGLPPVTDLKRLLQHGRVPAYAERVDVFKRWLKGLFKAVMKFDGRFENKIILPRTPDARVREFPENGYYQVVDANWNELVTHLLFLDRRQMTTEAWARASESFERTDTLEVMERYDQECDDPLVKAFRAKAATLPPPVKRAYQTLSQLDFPALRDLCDEEGVKPFNSAKATLEALCAHLREQGRLVGDPAIKSSAAAQAEPVDAAPVIHAKGELADGVSGIEDNGGGGYYNVVVVREGESEIRERVHGKAKALARLTALMSGADPDEDTDE